MKSQLSEDYRFYYDALERQENSAPVEFPQQPQSGRYLTDAGLPVVLWRDPADQKMRLRIGDETSSFIEEGNMFKSFVADNWRNCTAITKERYDKAIAGPGPQPSRQHNQPPVENSLTDLGERVNDLVREAKGLLAAGAARSKTTADTAADLANMLSKLSQLADDKRKQEQQEWRERITVSNAQWYPVRDTAADVSVRLKKIVIDPYLDWVEAAARAELERQAQQGQPAHPEETERKATAGTRGRPVSRRTVTEVAIIDYHAAINHFRDHPEVVALVQKLAARAAKIGVTVPGTEIIKGKVSV